MEKICKNTLNSVESSKGMEMSGGVRNDATLPWREGEDAPESDVEMMSECQSVR